MPACFGHASFSSRRRVRTAAQCRCHHQDETYRGNGTLCRSFTPSPLFCHTQGQGRAQKRTRTANALEEANLDARVEVRPLLFPFFYRRAGSGAANPHLTAFVPGEQAAIVLDNFLTELIKARDFRGRRLAEAYLKLPARNAKYFKVRRLVAAAAAQPARSWLTALLANHAGDPKADGPGNNEREASLRRVLPRRR